MLPKLLTFDVDNLGTVYTKTKFNDNKVDSITYGGKRKKDKLGHTKGEA